MWSGTVTNKGLQNGSLSVTVTYTNGTDSFNETFNVSTKYEVPRIPDRIAERITDLEAMQSFADDTSAKLETTDNQTIPVVIQINPQPVPVVTLPPVL